MGAPSARLWAWLFFYCGIVLVLNLRPTRLTMLATATLGVFVRSQITHVFFRIRILFAHFGFFLWFLVCWNSAAGNCFPHGKVVKLVSQIRLMISLSVTAAAALGVLVRFQITHFNFWFLFFAHITFLSLFFGFGLRQSRRKVVPLRPSCLESDRPIGSTYLANAFAVELYAPRHQRPFFPSANSRFT